MTPTAPSPADEARAHTLVETYRRQWPDLAGYGLLEAAETLSAALQAERTKHEQPRWRTGGYISPGGTVLFGPGDAIDPPSPPPPNEGQRIGIPRLGWFARRFTVVHVAACTVVGGAVWAGLGWIIWTVVT